MYKGYKLRTDLLGTEASFTRASKGLGSISNTYKIHFVALQELSFGAATELMQAEWLDLYFPVVRNLSSNTAEIYINGSKKGRLQNQWTGLLVQYGGFLWHHWRLGKVSLTMTTEGQSSVSSSVRESFTKLRRLIPSLSTKIEPIAIVNSS